jgi:hypothetical protein
MNIRRRLILFVSVALLLSFGAGEAQQSKIPRIAFLHSASADSVSARRHAFQEGLRALGYTARTNIIVEYPLWAGRLSSPTECRRGASSIQCGPFRHGRGLSDKHGKGSH